MRIIRNQVGLTLIEVVVSSGIVGIMFVVIMALLGQVGFITGVFSSQEATMAAVVDSVGTLNATMPLVTRVTQCNCRSASGTRATCIWEPSLPWANPVFDYGQSGTVVLLAGEFETHDGPDTSMQDVLNLSSFGADSCASANSIGLTYRRGCKVAFELKYTPPTALSSTAVSKAGTLRLEIPGRGAGAAPKVAIGKATDDGAGNVGVTELSCGFDNQSAGKSSSVFVLNFRVKAKNYTTRNSLDRNYESWYPRSGGTAPYASDKNFNLGQHRDIRLKWAFRNISERGVYAWRGESARNCKINGAAASNFTQCCSQAMSGGACVACTRGGQAAVAASACCSGSLQGGVCN